MSVEIIRHSGDLKREVWEFSLRIDLYLSCIYLDSFSFQTRTSKRHKWQPQTHWSRLYSRDNNIGPPSLPTDVVDEMRSRFQEYILSLLIRF